METKIRTQKKDDRRLKELVRSTQDITCAVQHGVPQLALLKRGLALGQI